MSNQVVLGRFPYSDTPTFCTTMWLAALCSGSLISLPLARLQKHVAISMSRKESQYRITCNQQLKQMMEHPPFKFHQFHPVNAQKSHLISEGQKQTATLKRSHTWLCCVGACSINIRDPKKNQSKSTRNKKCEYKTLLNVGVLILRHVYMELIEVETQIPFRSETADSHLHHLKPAPVFLVASFCGLHSAFCFCTSSGIKSTWSLQSSVTLLTRLCYSMLRVTCLLLDYVYIYINKKINMYIYIYIYINLKPLYKKWLT